jgi:hypothetical protein
MIFQQNVIKQGVAGKVYLRQGNYMPAPGQKASEGKPVNTSVYIYELTTREQAIAEGTNFSKIETKLVARGQSNNDGYYAIALSPGNYSVFVSDNGKLYANSFDGKGNINKVTVLKDSVTHKDIIISNGAVY